MSQLFVDLTAAFSHSSQPTPFGTFDGESVFATDCDSMVRYVYSKLGGNVLQVELTNKDVYTSMEESALEYSATLNTYHARSILADIIGSTTGSLTGQQNKVARMNLSLAKRRAQAYSSEVLVGGTKTLHSASITLRANQQHYNLNVLLSSSTLVTGSQRAEIKEIFHFSPTAAFRFFDTTSAINYLHNEFSFESFTPETVFYILPIWEDVLRAQMLETSHNIRRSNYSYNLVNNVLSIFPVPTKEVSLYFTYYHVVDDPFNETNDPFVVGVSNLSNVPFGAVSYAKVNSIGRQWIRRFSFALSKEVLGMIRGKVGNIPIPNGEMILNADILLSNGREEQLTLREELRAMFESTTYQALAQQEVEAAENLRRQLSVVPLGGVWVGIFSLLSLLPLNAVLFHVCNII